MSTVSFNGLYEIALTTGTSVAASITNTGTLSGDKIVISALDAANAVSGVINLEGILQANSIQVHGGLEEWFMDIIEQDRQAIA